jgi:hypothetical protein
MHPTVQHFTFIDFNPYPTDLDGHKPCYRSTVSTHISQADVGSFTDDLNRQGVLKYFSLGMQLMDVNRKAWFTMTPRFSEPNKAPHHENDAARGMMDLITLLNRKRLPIIWKEDGYGYLIGTGGVIIRKWELLTDNVPF